MTFFKFCYNFYDGFMLRKIFPLFLSLIIFIPFFIFNQEEPISEETHYYLKEWINEDGLLEACLLEGDSLPPESIPEGFVKVSLEELHAKGYLTGEEQLQMLIEKGIPPETVRVDPGRWACSWAYCWKDGGLLKGIAGSKTCTRNREKIKTQSWRTKTTQRGSERRASQPRIKTGPGEATVSWPLIQASKRNSGYLEIEIEGHHVWRYRSSDSIVRATYAWDYVE